MTATRFLKGIIIALLVINMATLAFLWVAPGGKGGRHEQEQGGPAEFIRQELQLTDAQQAKYKEMRDRHHPAMEALRSKARQYQQHLNDLLSRPTTDSTAIRHLADSIGYCQRDAATLTWYHFRELRAICTPKQQERLDVVVHEAVDRVMH